MAELVIPQGVLVRLIWRRGGADTAVNVLGATNVSAIAINQSLANSVGAAIKSSFNSTLAASVGTDVSLSQIGLRNINVANQAEFLDVNAVQAGLEGTSSLLPPQISLAVTLRTALAGPSYRGRVYLYGFTEAINDAGSLAIAATGTAAVSFVTGIQTALAAAGLTLAVLSRPQDAQPLAVPPKLAKAGWATPVTSIVLRNLAWDTQRRRAVAGI